MANDIPSFRELWGEDAIYFQRNDAPSLMNALEELAANDRIRLEYGNRAYQRALRRYNSKRMAEDYLALYSKLVDGQTAPLTVSDGVLSWMKLESSSSTT